MMFDGGLSVFTAVLAALSPLAAQQSAQESVGSHTAGDSSEIAPSLARDVRTRDERQWARMILARYPGEALRQQVQGSVGVQVAVTAVGRPRDCSVTSSSGHSVLDEAACNGILRYGRFDPALDQNGRAIPSTYSTTIAYQLNADPSSTLPRAARTRDEMVWARQIQMDYPVRALRLRLQGSVGVRAMIDTEGRVTRCFVTRSSSHAVLDTAACYGMLNFATFQPALNANGDPVAGVYSTRITYRLNSEPLPPPTPVEGGAREVII